jgi:hypothetical protein
MIAWSISNVSCQLRRALSDSVLIGVAYAAFCVASVLLLLALFQKC